MNNKEHSNKNTAFSLIELSIVILIIGLIVIGIVGGRKLVSLSNLTKARTLTNSSPVNATENLILWLETTSKDSYDSIPTDGQIISTWQDLNQQSKVKKSATAGNGPTYTENGINGLPVLRFNGSSNYLVSATNVNYTTYPNMTIFIVYTFYSGGGTIQAFFGQDDANWDRFILPQLNTVGNSGVSKGSNITNTPNISKFNTPQILSVVLQNGVTNGSTIYINGTSNTVFTESHNNTGTTSIGIGAINPSGQYPVKADIGEMIFFSRALSDLERQEIENYLSRKWGIKLT